MVLVFIVLFLLAVGIGLSALAAAHSAGEMNLRAAVGADDESLASAGRWTLTAVIGLGLCMALSMCAGTLL